MCCFERRRVNNLLRVFKEIDVFLIPTHATKYKRMVFIKENFNGPLARYFKEPEEAIGFVRGMNYALHRMGAKVFKVRQHKYDACQLDTVCQCEYGAESEWNEC